MIELFVPTHLLEDISEEEYSDIVNRSVGNEEFIVREDFRGHNSGQYIKMKVFDTIKYICLSRKVANESRNAFILQNFPSAYQHYLEEANPKKCFEYYIRDFTTLHPPFAIFSYKLLLTGGIKILNLDKVRTSDNATLFDYTTPFTDYKQMRTYRLSLSQRNSGNNSTTFEENDNEISVYGKSYGANGRETTAICLALSKLVKDKNIKLYNVNETDRSHLAEIDPANRYILENIGVELNDDRMDFESNDERVIAKRNTRLFHYNLLQKYKGKKCYLCGCDIEKVIQGAHIYSSSDILHSSMSEEEKTRQIVDADNGIWLCANHHLLFDYLLIYFKEKYLYAADTISKNQIEYIKESITQTYFLDSEKVPTDEHFLHFKINDIDFNLNMQQYLLKHTARFTRHVIEK